MTNWSKLVSSASVVTINYQIYSYIHSYRVLESAVDCYRTLYVGMVREMASHFKFRNIIGAEIAVTAINVFKLERLDPSTVRPFFCLFHLHTSPYLITDRNEVHMTNFYIG